MSILAIIGGGSAYTPGLIQALIQAHQRVRLDQIRLYDINDKHLDIVTRLTQKMGMAAGAPLTINAVANLKDAVEGADYVLNTVRPGGFEARSVDETISLEYGIPGQETVGPGGFFYALRTVPLALELSQTIKGGSAHRTLLLNYANPTNIVCQALHNAHCEVAIGLCDQAYEDIEILNRLLPQGDFVEDFTCFGLNHASFYKVSMNPLAIAEHSCEALNLDDEHKLRYKLSAIWAKEHQGYWPNSYLPYYWAAQQFVKAAKRRENRAQVIMNKLNVYYQHFMEEAMKDSPDLRYYRGSSGFGDLAVKTIEGLTCGAKSNLVVNNINGSTDDLFGSQTIVEGNYDLHSMSFLADGRCKVPDSCRTLLKRLERYQKAAASVASNVNCTHLELAEALAENPLVDDLSIAHKLIEKAKGTYGNGVIRHFV
jgi:6-phospho-beta-glucosidase